jgi:hypothetical protein
MKSRILLVALLVVGVAGVWGAFGYGQANDAAAPAKPGQPAPAVVKACAKAPVIDGDLNDDCWKTAEVVGVWIEVDGGKAANPQGKAYICYDDKFLYVAFLNPEPKMKDIKTEATQRDGSVWDDDANEFFVSPTAGKGDYYQIIVNANNVLYDGRSHSGEWDSNAKSATKKLENAWSLEIAIPLADLAAAAPLKGQTWTANFCRDRFADGAGQYFSWKDVGDDFHNFEAFGTLKME